MNAAEYAAKKASGLCLANVGCRGRRFDGRLCYKHHWQRRRDLRNWLARHKERYMKRKAAGICTKNACKEPAPNGVFCELHRLQHVGYMAKTKAKPGYRERHAAIERRTRLERERAGLCRLCNQPAVTRLCARHRRKEIDRNTRKRRAEGVAPDWRRCRRCRQPGHRWTTCQGLPVDAGAYATARRPVEMPA